MLTAPEIATPYVPREVTVEAPPKLDREHKKLWRGAIHAVQAQFADGVVHTMRIRFHVTVFWLR